MQLKSLSIALMTTALASQSLPVLAQGAAGPNLAPAAEAPAPGPVATLALAQELYATGLASGDALTVLTAAKLAAATSVTVAEAAALDAAMLEATDDTTVTRKKAAPGAPAAPAPMMNDGARPVAMVTVHAGTGTAEAAGAAAPTADDMFASARTLAGDDPALLALIDDAAAESSRGAIGGMQQYEVQTAGGQTDVWEIAFAGNSYAEILVEGSGSGNLDLVVTDENGNVICYEASPSDQAYCDFIPAWDGYFYVTVLNTGETGNPYRLVTN